MPTNDNDPATLGTPFPSSDAHGHAALLLIESLIHGLCEKDLLSAGDVVEIAIDGIGTLVNTVEQAK